MQQTLWFVKSKRAQSAEDFETWVGGGQVIPTLNAFDVGEGREVVIIIDGTRVGDVRVSDEEIMQTVIQRWGTGGGNVLAIAYEENEESPILGGQHPNAAIGVDVSPTLTSASGMGGGHTPIISVSEPLVLRDREGKAGGGKGALISKTAFTLATSNFHTLFPNDLTVRRLTPIECERLQGFPDDWTAGQADSSRYKQMGNAVAVPVVNWIISRMVNNE